ncbi:hypothetical protein NON20_00955 [Synechocystis sp. B12]|nr:hypothetical protein NON20_00955 [Synechocystis sp. B12]
MTMLKKIFILLMLLAIAGAGLGYYFWRRATQIPAWFEAETSTPSIAPPADFLQEKIRQEIAQKNDGDRQEPVRVTLTEKELGQVLQGEVDRQLKMESIPRLQTQIRGKPWKWAQYWTPKCWTMPNCPQAKNALLIGFYHCYRVKISLFMLP